MNTATLKDTVETYLRDTGSLLFGQLPEMLVAYEKAETAHEQKEDDRASRHTGKNEYKRKPFKFSFSVTGQIVEDYMDKLITKTSFGVKDQAQAESRISGKTDMVDLMEKATGMTADDIAQDPAIESVTLSSGGKRTTIKGGGAKAARAELERRGKLE